MSSADLSVIHYIQESAAGVTPADGVRATGTLTGTANFADNETVTINGKVYTFKAALTETDGFVKVGTDLAASLKNLSRAINKYGGVPGTDYALATTENPDVTSTYTATTVVVTARVPSAAGNAITTTEVAANATWGGVTLAGGVDSTAALTWKTLRFNTESLNFAIENTQSEELRPDRTQTDLIQTSASSAGDVTGEVSYGSYDDFLQAAFCGAWTANVLKNGATRRFFSVRKGFTDAVPAQYHIHRGCVVEGFNISFEIGKIVGVTFNLMGFGIDRDTGLMTSTFPGEVVTAANANTPMNAVTNFQDIMIDSVPYSGCISKLSMALKNNIRAIQCLGSLGARDMRLGTIEVTGDAEFYFNDGTIYSRFVKGFEFDLRFELQDAVGNNYAMVLPRCKFETGEVSAGGRNTDVMMSGKYRALYHAGSAAVAQITRTPA